MSQLYLQSIFYFNRLTIDRKRSRSAVSDPLQPHTLQPIRLLCLWDFPGKGTGVGCHFLLQGILPTQGLNLGLPHCRQMLYILSHQGSPRLTTVYHKFIENKFPDGNEKLIVSYTKAVPPTNRPSVNKLVENNSLLLSLMFRIYNICNYGYHFKIYTNF